MRILRIWAAKLQGLFALNRAHREFDLEMREHLELLTERFVSRGMARKEATKAARRQFGNAPLLQQKQREARSFPSLSEWLRDISFGLRMLRKNPGSNAAVIVALALGIGMNTAVFSFVNALLLRPPAAIKSTGSLFEIWQHNKIATGVQSYLPFTYPDYTYYRDQSKTFTGPGAGLVAFDGDGASVIWNRQGEGEAVHGQLVSGNYFSVLGVNAEIGRALSIQDDQPGNPRPVVILSHSFWQQKMGADPSVVGRTLMLNGGSVNVVGVAPAGFTGLVVGLTPDFWAPISMVQQLTREKERLTNRHSYWLLVAGRLKFGSDRVAAQTELHFLARQLEKDRPDSNKNLDALLYPATLVPGPYRGYVSAFTGLLMAVFGLVLLIACTNAASLLLARATGRAREMAIRSALGARLSRLVRQMLVESLLLSSIAGIAGVVLASWATHLLMTLKPASLPITLETPLDWRVLLFALAVTIGTGVIFGIVPALRSARVDAAPVLKEETQSAGLKKSRLRSVLLIAEIAVCVVLLTGATLCVRSLMHANSIDPGFDTQHIAVATLDPGSLGYSDAKVASFYRELLEHVRALPGVTAVSYASHLPLGTSREATSVGLRPGKDYEKDNADVFRIAPDYFQTMGVTLLRGRDFTRSEIVESSEDAPAAVAVINEALARKLWPGRDPVGQRIAIGEQKTTAEVIGVVKTGKYRTLGEESTPAIYRTLTSAQRTLLVRTSGNSRSILEAIRREVQIVDPLMAATDVQTIEEFMALPLFPARATGLLLGASGILAVMLTTIGLFGVIAYVVSQRTHEIGVRMALGARRSDVMKLVMRQGLYLTLIGLAIGLAAASATARLLSPLLYGITANDPATLIGVSVGLTTVAMLACYIPARRAMSVDPMAALRYE
jgi:predicted permease